MSATDVEDIELLRKEKKTWSQIKDLKYPGRSWRRVRELFLEQKLKLGKQDDKDGHLEGKEEGSVADEEEVNV